MPTGIKFISSLSGGSSTVGIGLSTIVGPTGPSGGPIGPQGPQGLQNNLGGVSSQFIYNNNTQATGSFNALYYTETSTGSNVYCGNSFLPSIDNVYNLGSPKHLWKSIYISTGTIFIGPTGTLGLDGNGVISSQGGFATPFINIGSITPGNGITLYTQGDKLFFQNQFGASGPVSIFNVASNSINNTFFTGGNLGIGINNPTYPLTVKGTIYCEGLTGTNLPVGPQGFQGRAGQGFKVFATTPSYTGLNTIIATGGNVGEFVLVTGGDLFVYYGTGAGSTGPGNSYGYAGDVTDESKLVGVQGAQGIMGVQGFQGLAGTTGTNGNQGFQGLIGPTGTNGNQGFQGLAGTTGTNGNQGFQGPSGGGSGTGSTGPQGFQGTQGFQGIAGAAVGSLANVKMSYTRTTDSISVSTAGTKLYAFSGATGVFNTPSTNITFNSSNGRFTVSEQGDYYLDARLIIKANSNPDFITTDVYVNSNTGPVYSYTHAAYGIVSPVAFPIGMYLPLNANDYVHMSCFLTGTLGPMNLKAGSTMNLSRMTNGPSGAQGPIGFQGLQGLQGFQGLMGPTGAGGALGYYGSFYDTTVQYNTGPAGSINYVRLNKTVESNGVYISSGSYVNVQNAGVYNIQFSIQVNKTNSNQDEVEIWLIKNGVNVPDTNTFLTLNTNNSKAIAAWNFVETLNSMDNIQLGWYSTDNELFFQTIATGTSPSRPLTPSVILTVQQVMNTQLGPTGSIGPQGLVGSDAPSNSLTYYLDTVGGAYSATSFTGSLLTTPQSSLNTSLITTGNQTNTTINIANFISSSIPTTTVQAGNWDLNLYGFANASSAVSFYYDAFYVDADGISNQTLLAAGTGAGAIFLNTAQSIYTSSLYVPTTLLPDTTKRILIKLYLTFSGNNRNATLEFRDGTLSHLHTTIFSPSIAAGQSSQIIFNQSGSYTGSSNLIFNSNRLTTSNLSVSSNTNATGSATGALIVTGGINVNGESTFNNLVYAPSLEGNFINRGNPGQSTSLLLNNYNTVHYYSTTSATGFLDISTTMVENAVYEVEFNCYGASSANDDMFLFPNYNTSFGGTTFYNVYTQSSGSPSLTYTSANSSAFYFDYVSGSIGWEPVGKIKIFNTRGAKKVKVEAGDTTAIVNGQGYWTSGSGFTNNSVTNIAYDTATQWSNIGRLTFSSGYSVTFTNWNVWVKRIM